MIHFAVTRAKRPIPEEFLAAWGRDLADRVRVLEWEEIAGLEEIPAGAWVLSDLDALGPAGSMVAAAVADTVSDAGHTVLNDPRRSLDRAELLRVLHERGMNDFRAVRATGAWRELRFPVFVRGADDHLGALGGLLEGPDDVVEALEEASSLGLDPEGLLVVEFLDTSRDGLFRKHGSYRVGDRIVPQHVFYSPEWMIKHKSTVLSEEIAAEELELLRSRAFEDDVLERFELAGIEYGRMDYSVDADGRVQVWEINLSPIIGRPPGPSRHTPPEMAHLRVPRKELFYRRFREAWEAVDEPVEEGTTLPLAVDGELREAMVREMEPDTGAAGLTRLLRAKRYFRHW